MMKHLAAVLLRNTSDMNVLGLSRTHLHLCSDTDRKA